MVELADIEKQEGEEEKPLMIYNLGTILMHQNLSVWARFSYRN